MKKHKTVADLLTATDICIEAFEARARLLESRGKGPSRKRDDWEVSTAEQGDQKDRGGHWYHRKQSSDQKEKTPGPLAGDTAKMHVAKKSTTVTPTSTQRAIDQLVVDERKGATHKEIQADPSNADKKLRISTELEVK
jgi:hypothetical protein